MAVTDIVIRGEFEFRTYPFWEIRNESSKPLALRQRSGGRAPVVCVKNPQRSDYRVKVWLDGEPTLPAILVDLNGKHFTLTGRGGGFYAGSVNGLDLSRALNGPPVDDEFEDENYEPGEYLDACIETVFTAPDSVYGRSHGDVSSFPSWMRARDITITPVVTTGGWHSIILDAPGMDPYRDETTIPAVRVNGVWCLAQPCVDEHDANGYMSWGGRWQLLCPPDDLSVVRGYGQEGELIELVDEPVPPRSVYALRSLHMLVGIPRREYFDWRRNIKQLNQSVVGMASLQGQIDVYQRESQYSSDCVSSHERSIRYWEMRHASGRDSSSDLAKIAEKLEALREKKKGFESRVAAANGRVKGLRTRLVENDAQYDTALAVCMAYEEAYADAIAQLFPDIGA